MINYPIQKTFYKVADFISWQRAGNLVLSPDFQRRSVWKVGAKSYLIDSILKGLPIPIIFLRDKRIDINRYEPIREVIDGQQRLRTVLSFVVPELLSDYKKDRDAFTVLSSHNKEIAGKTFHELNDEQKGTILDYEFNVHILPSLVDDREVIQIFRRMNSTNYILTKQEQRNSQFFGEFKTSVYKLGAEQLNRWRTWKTFTEDDISRMQEVEFTSECVITIIDGQISGKSSAKIDNAFKKFDVTYKNKEIIEDRFRATMDTMEKHFGKYNSDLKLFKKTLIYTFFTTIYHNLFDLKGNIDKVCKPKELAGKFISHVKLCNDRIINRTAPKSILDSSDRRTTNPKERKILFDYLKDYHAKEN